MRLSLIIPAYNEEKYIEKCLLSIVSQKEKPDEIIVVDNNCSDRTTIIAKKYNARIVKEKKQGMIHARNAGFDAAKYELIGRIDADTILPAYWISKIKSDFKNKKIEALSGPVSYYGFPASKFLSLLFFKIISLVLKTDCLFGPNMIIKKNAWEKVKNTVCLKDRDVHEDLDLTIHMKKHAKIKFDRKLTITTDRMRLRKILTTYVAILAKMLITHRNLI
jgi:glycosyltransferase involved in cell wall biosynthesis